MYCTRREFEYCGTVREVERDIKTKSALVEMKRYHRIVLTTSCCSETSCVGGIDIASNSLFIPAYTLYS